MSKSREQLNDLLKKVEIEGKVVLDVGCQDHLSSRLTTGTPAKYLTNDIDKQWNPDWLFDLNEPFDCLKIGDEHYCGRIDTIFCIEVLEHCWNPVEVLKTFSALLKDGGDVYISAPFINPHHDYWDYLRFTGEWYEKALDKCGIEIVQIDERIATLGRPLLEQFYKIEGMKISKIRPEYGRYTYPIGYLVHGRKKQTDNREAH